MFLMAAALCLPMLFGAEAAQAGPYHPFYRRLHNQYHWNVWNFPVWNTSTVEDLYWRQGMDEGSAPRLYYNHYGEPVSGSCVVVNGWTDCSATQPPRFVCKK